MASCRLQTAIVRVCCFITSREDNAYVNVWPLGRIEEVILGEDGLVRVVHVRISRDLPEAGDKDRPLIDVKTEMSWPVDCVSPEH